MSDITPTGYISLHDASRLLARIDDYTEADHEWLDIGDRLNDAQAMHDATRELRQHLCNGVLVGYYFVGDGKSHRVPEGTWTEDEACLERVDRDLGFEHLYFFHSRGIEIGSVRQPVFLSESEFEKFQKSGAEPKKTMAPKDKGTPGRRKGDGSKPDEKWLDAMQEKVLRGASVYEAASDIFHENIMALKAESDAEDLNIIKRLYDKYRRSKRAGSPLASN